MKISAPNQAVAELRRRHHGPRAVARVTGKSPGTVQKWFHGQTRPRDDARAKIEARWKEVGAALWDVPASGAAAEPALDAPAAADIAPVPRTDGDLLEAIVHARRAAFAEGRIADALRLVTTEVTAWRRLARERGELAPAFRARNHRKARQVWANAANAVAAFPDAAKAWEAAAVREGLGVLDGKGAEGLDALANDLSAVQGALGQKHALRARVLAAEGKVRAARAALDGDEAELVKEPDWRALCDRMFDVLAPWPDVLDALVDAVDDV